MNIEYRKIFNKNYAIIDDYNVENYQECYRSKMMKSNHPEHFLTYDTQSLNGKIRFTYDISSKQSVFSFYENCDIEFQTIRHFILSLKEALDTLNNYLLEPDFMILDPRMIYMNVATKALYFCYCPGENHPFYDSLNEFLNFLLSKIDPEDHNSIILAYSLQQSSINKNYTIDDLLEIINKSVFQTPPGQKEEPDIITPLSSEFLSGHKESDNPEHVSSFDFENIDLTTGTISKNVTTSPEAHKNSLYMYGTVSLFSLIMFLLYFKFDLISQEICLISIAGIIAVSVFFRKKFSEKTSPILENYSDFSGASVSKEKHPDFSSTPVSKEKHPDFSGTPVSVENYSSSCDVPHIDRQHENKIVDIFPDQNTSYEDTVIIGYHSPNSCPKLVYTGTDFKSEINLTHFPFIIGKMSDNVDMVIDNPMISRIHAKLYCKDDIYYIEDMNSSNGTYLNNTILQPHSLTELKEGDFVTFSHLTYLFQ